MIRRFALWGAIPIAAIAFALLEVPMALGKTVTLFSEISATLVDGDGNPQSGIKVERR